MNRKGFTLIELAVVVIIIAILATMATVFFKGDYSAQKKCAQNLRIISDAIEQYVDANNGQYPPDGTINPANNLKSALYPAYISDASVFKCPADTDSGSTDSYSAFYVKRNNYSKMTTFSVGCPRHDNGKSAMNLFFQGQTLKRELAEATDGSGVLTPGSDISDTATMADGSTVSSSGAVTFLQSFDIGKGMCYSLFKSNADPKDIAFNVTPGAKLEIITPSAIAGVEGTQFLVKIIDAAHADITTLVGKVRVEEKTGAGQVDVLSGRTTSVVSGKPPITRPCSESAVDLPASITLTATAKKMSDSDKKYVVYLEWSCSNSSSFPFSVERRKISQSGEDANSNVKTFVFVVATGTTQFRDTGVHNKKTYEYKVRAQAGGNYSPYSKPARVTVE